MKMHPDYKSCFKILKGGKISLVVSALLGATTISFAAPSGGVVTSGSATISQNGTTTNINQSTQKATINWQKFSVASNETVNFNQPNVNSITLNRVIGNEKSIINGALNANGQVWILNSNGVLFGKNASINTAGLLATTAQLSDTDFNAGNYHFKNATANSVINEGTITISDAGSVILASNEIRNQGTIKAIKGKVHLVGSSEYTVNLNGNSLVNLKVNKGVLDALVENSGHIIADGGEIYLTTNTVNELLKGVVNNTGIIEANSLDGLTGHVELFAHGGEVQVGGSIEAKDGFVETSGKDFTFLNANIKAGEWLIDPVNITIDAALAGAIETALGGGDVTIETDTPDHSDVDTSSGESGSDGNITVDSAITWSANKLTLTAINNIIINANMNATGTGSMSFYYGQGTANGAGSNYTVADNVSITVPSSTGVTYKKGSAGAETYLSFNNGNLRTLNYNTTSSFDANGILLQPWYYNSDSSTWYKLTHGTKSIEQGLAISGDGTSTWNTNGILDDTPYNANLSYEISKYNPNGYGKIEVTNTTTIDSKTVEIKNNYSLAESDRYLNVTTTVTNKETVDSISNVRYWVGARDDWVGNTDSPTKIKGNVDGDGFTQISNSSEHSAALKLTDTATDSVLLFYTGSNKAITVLNSSYGAFLEKVMKLDPYSSAITNSSDGAYGLYVRFDDLVAGASDSFTWSYAAATSAQMDAIQQTVSGNTPTPTPTPTTNTNEEVNKVVTAIVNTNAIKVNVPKITPPVIQPQTVKTTITPTIDLGFGEGTKVSLVSKPLEGEPSKVLTLSDIRAMQTTSPSSETGGTQQENNNNGFVVQETRVALSSDSIVDLVNGGVNLPDGVEQEFYVVEDKRN